MFEMSVKLKKTVKKYMYQILQTDFSQINISVSDGFLRGKGFKIYKDHSNV